MTRDLSSVAALLMAACCLLAEEGTPPLPSVRVRESQTPNSLLPPPTVEDAAIGSSPVPEEVAAEDGAETTECVPIGPLRRLWHYRVKPCLQASHWGYADEFEHRPFGTYMRAAGAAQVSAGFAAQLTLYAYDFAAVDGGPSPQFNAYGQQRFLQLAEMSLSSGYPIVIERDERQPQLSESRRQFVLTEMRRLHPDLPEDRVIVGRPSTRPLTAAEAVEIDQNFLRHVQSGPTNSLGNASTSSQTSGFFGFGGNSSGTTARQ